MYVDYGNENQKTLTLEGIVNGGVGQCGTSMPRWYTRVSAHKEWIDCIVTGIEEEKTKLEIDQLCGEKVLDYPSKNRVFD